MISEPFARQFDVDVPERAPSAARLAAEAFFAPRSEPVPGESAPDVVVKKSRLEESEPSAAAHASAPLETARAPRVFRLAAPLAVADITEPKVQDAPVGAPSDPSLQVGTLHRDVPSAPRASGRRTQRRHLHGEVTITRPSAPSVGVPTSQPGVTLSLQVLPAAQPLASSDFASPEWHAQDWPRYLVLRRQLLALQAQAQEAKRRKAQAALVWIRQAIADYDITPGDLGL
ncbi:hypothetical protein [Aquincola sp. J276]|uniref:hypothetical protein n=1 Tax=Aquincola sp. J276 TaxID=2898432 RepID=UPI00215155C5|nr:hypothetical protein [Aquincola sp. J276]MCR5868147.1 hypothetical protein [Aquincola sp. J276]